MNQEQKNNNWIKGISVAVIVFFSLYSICVIAGINRLVTGEREKGDSSVEVGIIVLLVILIVAFRNEGLHRQLRNKEKEESSFSPRFQEILKKAEEDLSKDEEE